MTKQVCEYGKSTRSAGACSVCTSEREKTQTLEYGSKDMNISARESESEKWNTSTSTGRKEEGNENAKGMKMRTQEYALAPPTPPHVGRAEHICGHSSSRTTWGTQTTEGGWKFKVIE